jgi:tetratricopeptide (TPR) repeat protein
MIRAIRHRHLFTREWETPQYVNRLYFHYSSYDEDGVINTREFRETALASYEQAIQLAPHEANLHYHRGQLLEQLGRLTEAGSAFEEADRLGYQRAIGIKALSMLVDAEQSHP